jgi:hypothetical protein
MLAGCNRTPAICSRSEVLDRFRALIMHAEPSAANEDRARELLDISNISGNGPTRCSADFSIRPAALTRLRQSIPQYEQALPVIARKEGLSGGNANSGHADYLITSSPNQVKVTMSTFSEARARLYSAYADRLSTMPMFTANGRWDYLCDSPLSPDRSCLLIEMVGDRSGALQGGMTVSDQQGLLFATLYLPADTDPKKRLVLSTGDSVPTPLQIMKCSIFWCVATLDLGSDQTSQPNRMAYVHGQGVTGRQIEIGIPFAGFAAEIALYRSQLADVVADTATITDPAEETTWRSDDIQLLLTQHPSSKSYHGIYRLPDFQGRDREFSSYRAALSNGIRNGADYAGSYRIVRVACGTGCSYVFVADVPTGRVYRLPVSGEAFPQIDLKYTLDSTAILVRWIWSGGDPRQKKCIQQTFTWNGTRFEELTRDALPLARNACPGFPRVNVPSPAGPEIPRQVAVAVPIFSEPGVLIEPQVRTSRQAPPNASQIQSDEAMASRFGNTEILLSNTVEWHMFFRPNGRFSAYDARSQYQTVGTWQINGGNLCITFEPPLANSPNPVCRPVTRHRLGDVWMVTNGSVARLVRGIR